MDKKALLIVIIAGILALIGAYLILKPNHNNIEPLVPVEQEEVTSEPEQEQIEEVKTEEQEDNKALEVSSAKNASYKKPAVKQAPKTASAPVIKPIVVQEAEPEKIQTAVSEEIQNSGVIEESSNVVVVTKEYKVQSPSRYSFK